ncbi:hypothetical protein D3C78_460400 [compost metagenome]
MKPIWGLLPLLLTGCASVSDVWPVGDGMYVVSAAALPGIGGAAKANEYALHKAQRFCGQKDYRVLLVNEDYQDLTRLSISGSFYRVGKSYTDDMFKHQRDSVVFKCGAVASRNVSG